MSQLLHSQEVLFLMLERLGLDLISRNYCQHLADLDPAQAKPAGQ
jgi:hypothetical protein